MVASRFYKIVQTKLGLVKLQAEVLIKTKKDCCVWQTQKLIDYQSKFTIWVRYIKIDVKTP